jgi:hypothetical protein
MLFRHHCRARVSAASYSRAATVTAALVLTGDMREFFDKTMRFHRSSFSGPFSRNLSAIPNHATTRAASVFEVRPVADLLPVLGEAIIPA